METEDAIIVFDALSQATRLDIFRLLVQAGFEGMPAGAIGRRLGVPNATLSFHLQQLRHAKLAATKREGTLIRYIASYETIKGLVDFVMDNCCQGQYESCSGGTALKSPARKTNKPTRRKS